MISKITFCLFLVIINVSVYAGTRVWDFEDVALDDIPSGWKTMTGETSGANNVSGDGTAKVEFGAVEDETAPGAESGNKVIKILDHLDGAIYGHGHHLWTDEVSFKDGTIEVDLKPHPGDRAHCGVSFRIKDYKNFYASRFHATQGNINVCKVVDGNVHWHQKSSGTAVNGTDKWYKYKVEVEGSKIKVSLNDVQYIEWTDSDIEEAGGVGLFTRGDVSVISWDNLSVTSDDITSVYPGKRILAEPELDNTGYAIFDLQGRLIGNDSGTKKFSNRVFIRKTEGRKAGKIMEIE